MEKTIRKNIVDTYIAFAVGIQPLLVILQQVLLDVVHMDEVTATALRVALTASTMTPAIIISTFRKPVLFIATYLIVFIALLLNSLVFPTNDVFIKKEAFRFLLPVSIPSCLCLLTIHDFFVFEKTLCKISIVSFLLVIIYVVAFFMGVFFIEDYDMSFGYGCLLPMVILYSKDHKLYKLL